MDLPDPLAGGGVLSQGAIHFLDLGANTVSLDRETFARDGSVQGAGGLVSRLSESLAARRIEDDGPSWTQQLSRRGIARTAAWTLQQADGDVNTDDLGARIEYLSECGGNSRRRNG